MLFRSKNKMAPPFKSAEFDMLYGEGISREGSVIDMAQQVGVVKKSIENAKETAEKNKSQILSDATQEAVRLKEKAQQEIAHNKEEALNSIKGDVADLTVHLAGKLLSQQLDAEGQRRLIDRYLDELGEA